MDEVGTGSGIDKKVPTRIDRPMRVIIDEVSEGTSYDLWLDVEG